MLLIASSLHSELVSMSVLFHHMIAFNHYDTYSFLASKILGRSLLLCLLRTFPKSLLPEEVNQIQITLGAMCPCPEHMLFIHHLYSMGGRIQVIVRTALNLAFPLFMCSRAFGASAKGNVSIMHFTPWICANLIASSLSRACPEGQP